MIATCTLTAVSTGTEWVRSSIVSSMSMLLPPPPTSIMYFVWQSEPTNFLSLPRRPDQRFHVIQVAFQRPAPPGGQPVFRFGQPPVKRFCAHDVVRLLEFPSVHAQVPIRCLQQGLQLVERQRTIHGQCADNAQPDALVNQPVQIR